MRHSLASLLLLVATAATAQVDPAHFSDLHWRLVGPFRGGRVLAVTGVPDEPEHFYFGSVNGGVWETRDAGRTWNPIFDSQPAGSIGAIAVAPSDARVLYVGTGEADMRSDISQGDGMYKSEDGGKSWRHIGLHDTQQIGRVIVHPDNPNIVYVAALGHPYAANEQRGVFRSLDGGETWQKVLGPNNDTGAIDLAFEPGNPNTLYAALWQTRRTPWSVYPPSNGPGSGLWKSTDAGDHWTPLRNGLPEKVGRIGIAAAPSKPRRVYAIVDSAEAGGMYRSDDAGASWKRVGTDARIWSRGWYFGGIAVEPNLPDVVYSCNVNVYRSADGGATWTPIKGAPGGDDYHALWIDPREPKRRILGVDQGTVVSLNGGDTWSSWFNQPTGQFYHVSTDQRFPYWLYGSQQDSGSAAVPSRSTTIDGINMTEFREPTVGGESDNLAPDPKDPDIIYGGRVDRLDLRTKQTQSVDPTLAYPANDRRTWTLPLAFSHRDPRVLYFAHERLYRTEDGGKHWTVISPDLTREDPGVPPNLDPITASIVAQPGNRHGVIYAIAPSRTADHDVWIGTDDGSIWRTQDEGVHWQNVTPAELTGWSKVGIIDTSHFDADTAYAAVDRHRLDDFAPYIYRTHDGGKHWQQVSAGIPRGSFVNVVREDSVRKGLLYAGTEKGMYVSFDDGDHWQPLQLNLPVTSVRDIDIHENDVVIATHGRAFWILDDVAPLRQRVDSAPFLYKPADAVRFRGAAFAGTPMPKDEPMAPNPPSGAYIDYVLAAPARSVLLDILDNHGMVVRHYSSDDTVPVANPATLHTAPEWFATPVSLRTTPGMHRFVWPLRYPAAGPLADGRGPWADGIWAPPGKYTVALTVDGKHMEQPLLVLADPRVHLAPEAFAEQFAFAQRVEAQRAGIAAALEEANDFVDKLTERRKTATGAAASSIDDLLAKVRDLAEIRPVDAWWQQPHTTTSLRFLDGAFEKLYDAVDGADAAPTIDARESFDKLKPVAEAALRTWSELRVKVNATLSAKPAP